MKLKDIHLNFNTDKGTDHNYIEVYDSLFEKIRTKKNNFLEIGVLLGGSLKMWEQFFENSTIYGVDDFSQKDTNETFGRLKVDPENIKKELNSYERIKFIECDSRNSEKVKSKISSLGIKFDVIIDDGEHSIPCQIDNFENFIPLLNKSGIYVIEDCRGPSGAEEVKKHILKNHKNFEIKIHVLDVEKRSDDVLMVVTRKKDGGA